MGERTVDVLDGVLLPAHIHTHKVEIASFPSKSGKWSLKKELRDKTGLEILKNEPQDVHCSLCKEEVATLRAITYLLGQLIIVIVSMLLMHPHVRRSYHGPL